MFKMTNRFIAVLIAAPLMMSAGCSSSDDDDTVVVTPPPTPTSKVRVIHASPDAPPVNVLLNGGVAVPDLDFGSSSGFADVDAGAYDITVEGIIPGGNANVIEISGFALDADTRNTVLAVGKVAAIEALPVAESASTPGSSEVAVAVVHAAPAAPAVDIFVSAPADDITMLTPTATLAFKENADAGLVPVGEIRIRAAVSGNVVFDSGTVDLAPFAGSKLFIAAIESATTTEALASPIKLLISTDDAAVTVRDIDTGAGARVVHASPDAASAAGGPVEVFATSDALGMAPVELIAAFDYTDVFPGAATTAASLGYAGIPAGTYTFDVAPDTDTIGDSVFTSPALDLGAAIDYSVIAVGRVTSTPGFTLLATADNNRPIVTEARVKVIHAAPAAGNVDVYVTTAGEFSADMVAAGMAGDPLLADFAFETITDYVSVAPGSYDIRVVAGGVVAINVEGFSLPAGLVANVIARGPTEPTGSLTDFGLIVTTN